MIGVRQRERIKEQEVDLPHARISIAERPVAVA